MEVAVDQVQADYVHHHEDDLTRIARAAGEGRCCDEKGVTF